MQALLTLPLLSVFALALPEAQAGLSLTDDSQASFASVEAGRRTLGARDDFVEQLGPFDRAARLQTDADVSEAAFLQHVTRQVRPWSQADKARLSALVADLRKALSRFRLPLPKVVELIKTTGLEEADAAYTRGTAIVLPQGVLALPDEQVQGLLAHELFHIASRHDPGFRDRLYSAIGFERCSEVALPGKLAARRLTNPDAPRFEHFIEVSANGKEHRVVPVIFSRRERYDTKAGGKFFDYLVLRLLAVSFDPEKRRCAPIVSSSGEPLFFELDAVDGFYAKVGRNTGYVLHPEEVLADNFMQLLLGRRPPASPEVHERLRRLLSPASPDSQVVPRSASEGVR